MQLVKIKSGVNVNGIHPHLWIHLGIIARIFFSEFGFPLTVTSLRRGYKQGIVSKHSPGTWTVKDWFMYLWQFFNEHDVEASSGDWVELPKPEYACAVDISRRDIRRNQYDWLDPVLVGNFCHRIQTMIGDQVGVVLEPEWLTEKQIAERGGKDNVTPHIHIQSKKTPLYKSLEQFIP